MNARALITSAQARRQLWRSALGPTLLLHSVLTVACQQSEQSGVAENASSAGPAPDRLAVGEPLVGTENVMGLRVPNGLRVASQYPKTAQLTGRAPLQTVTEELRKQVLTSHVEVTPTRSLFARVHVRGDARRRVLRIEAVREKNQTRVHIADITPAPVTEGLSAPERWERAGRNPDGTLKDRSKIY